MPDDHRRSLRRSYRHAWLALFGSLISFGAVNGEPESAMIRGKPKPLASGAKTADWPGFLGPTRDGVCTETRLLKHWPDDGPALIWEMPAGEGYAAPVIAGDRLVFFHRLGDQEIVDCLHPETGKRYWREGSDTDYRDRYGFSGGPRATPQIDGDRCYVVGVRGQLRCLDLKTGNPRWQVDTARQFGVPQDFFGVGSSPLIDGNRLIVPVGAPKGPTVAAFDKYSGKLIWKSGSEWTAGYASPIVATLSGRRYILAFAGGDTQPPIGGLLGCDPTSGAVAFRHPFRSKTYESVNASNPVVWRDHVFISSSYQTGGALMKIDGEGKCSPAWQTNDFGAHFGTPIVRGDYLYGISGMRTADIALVCLDLAARKLKWRHVPTWTHTVLRNGQPLEMEFTVGLGSLIWADGHFLMLGDAGDLLWIDLSPTGYKELARSRLFFARETWVAPVISRGLLYVCQNRPDTAAGAGPRLLCYDLRDAD